MTTNTDFPDDLGGHLDYLDDLRESGEINMLGAVPYLRGAFPELTRKRAKEILHHWMQTFDDHRQDKSKGAQ